MTSLRNNSTTATINQQQADITLPPDAIIAINNPSSSSSTAENNDESLTAPLLPTASPLEQLEDIKACIKILEDDKVLSDKYRNANAKRAAGFALLGAFFALIPFVHDPSSKAEAIGTKATAEVFAGGFTLSVMKELFNCFYYQHATYLFNQLSDEKQNALKNHLKNTRFNHLIQNSTNDDKLYVSNLLDALCSEQKRLQPKQANRWCLFGRKTQGEQKHDE